MQAVMQQRCCPTSQVSQHDDCDGIFGALSGTSGGRQDLLGRQDGQLFNGNFVRMWCHLTSNSYVVPGLKHVLTLLQTYCLCLPCLLPSGSGLSVSPEVYSNNLQHLKSNVIPEGWELNAVEKWNAY